MMTVNCQLLDDRHKPAVNGEDLFRYSKKAIGLTPIVEGIGNAGGLVIMHMLYHNKCSEFSVYK